MADIENTVAKIEAKVGRLLKENSRLRAAEAKSTERCRQLLEQKHNQDIVINKLKEQNTILKLGNSLAQQGDSTEIKHKINQLIQSIDKCLASL